MALLGQGFDDPQSAAIMALAGGLLQRNPGAGLLGANDAFLRAKQAGVQQQMMQMQMQQTQMGLEKARRDADTETQMRDAARQSFVSPERATALSMGPMPDGSNVPTVQPGFNMGGFVSQVMGIDPMKGMQYQQLLAKESPFNKLDPKDYTPESVRAFVGTGQKDYSLLQPRSKMEVSHAGQVYDPYKIAPGTTLADPNKPFTLGQNGVPVPNTDYQSYELKKAKAGSSSVTVNPDNLGLKPKDRFEMEGKLSDEYYKATDQDRKLISAVGKIKTALGQDGALKDTAAIYGFAKALDPEGAVRESDYAAVANTAGLIDRVRGYANKLLTGEKLTPPQRAEMNALASAWERVAESRLSAQRNRYTNQAGRYNLDPKAILDPASSPTGWKIEKVN